MLEPNTPLEPMPFKDIVGHVRAFCDQFGIPSADQVTADLTPNTVALRHALMAEENDEYMEAALRHDAVEIADALGDQLYILCGTILSHGMQDIIEEVFREIQASNMSKLGADGNPIYREDGKVLKGPGYFKPNIAAILKKNIEVTSS